MGSEPVDPWASASQQTHHSHKFLHSFQLLKTNFGFPLTRFPFLVKKI